MPVYKKKTTKDNKRKKVVKGKSVTGNSKFKSVTNKKTGTTVKTIKSGKGKNKTKATEVSLPSIMPMLRQLAPDSPMAKMAMKELKKPVMATRIKIAKMPPMASRAKMAKKK